jgi:hypothetical protein
VLGRTSDIGDIAAQVVTFCRADSVTGQVVVIDDSLPLRRGRADAQDLDVLTAIQRQRRLEGSQSLSSQFRSATVVEDEDYGALRGYLRQGHEQHARSLGKRP